MEKHDLDGEAVLFLCWNAFRDSILDIESSEEKKSSEIHEKVEKSPFCDIYHKILCIVYKIIRR